MGTVNVYRGGVVVAQAIVDDDLVSMLSRWRWQLDRKGYAHRCPSKMKVVVRRGKPRSKRSCMNIKMHRVVVNAPPGSVVDHINGNPLDNRRENLEICTNVENVYRQAARNGGYFMPRREFES